MHPEEDEAEKIRRKKEWPGTTNHRSVDGIHCRRKQFSNNGSGHDSVVFAMKNGAKIIISLGKFHSWTPENCDFLSLESLLPGDSM